MTASQEVLVESTGTLIAEVKVGSVTVLVRAPPVIRRGWQGCGLGWSRRARRLMGPTARGRD